MTNLTRALLLSGLMLLPLAGEAQAQRHNRGQRTPSLNRQQTQRRNQRNVQNGYQNGASYGRYNQAPVIQQLPNGSGYQQPTPATGRTLGQPVPQTDSVYDLRYR